MKIDLTDRKLLLQTAILAIFLLGAAFLIFKSGYFSPLKFSSFTVSLEPQGPAAPGSPMDVFFADLDQDKRLDFVVTRLALSEGKYKPVPVQIFHRRDKTWQQAHFAEEPLSIHARHVDFADFNKDGILDMIIADHGADTPPFPGGLSLLLLSKSARSYQREKNVPWGPSFNFHTCFIDANSDGRWDILQMNLGDNPSQDLRVYQQRANGKLDSIPRSLVANLTPHCWMSCHRADLNHDKRDEVIIGACDRDAGGITPSPNDIFVQKGDSGLFNRVTGLDPRLENSYWGTAAIATGDFNGDKMTDILTANHAFGYRESVAQVQFGKSNNRFLSSKRAIFRTDPTVPSFIPWIRVGDLNRDGIDDVLLFTRYVGDKKDDHPVTVLLGRKNQTFDLVELKGLKSALHKHGDAVVGGDFLDYNEDGKMDIALYTYSGEMVIFQQE